jgi:hypothetical protein
MQCVHDSDNMRRSYTTHNTYSAHHIEIGNPPSGDATRRPQEHHGCMTHHQHTPPELQHSFVLLTPHHPTLLQCRIDSPEPLRQVQAELVCSERMELVGHYYDRQVGNQFFRKDILPGQFNPLSWRIYMPVSPPEGCWLCTVILTASNDAGQPVRHELPFHMPGA